MNKPYRSLLIVASLVVAAILIVPASAQVSSMESTHDGHQSATAMPSPDPHAAHNEAMNKPRYSVSIENYEIPDVQLIDASGSVIGLRSLLDSPRPVALNFIFTTCTTICPVMTATFAQMRRHLGANAEQLALVSISVDPEYDRPDVLKAYAAQFHASGNWTFLTGEGADIERVQRDFDTYAGSKMNHQPVTFLRSSSDPSWIRIDGLASGENLAQEVSSRLLN
jgi:protein SCO1/2